MVVMKFGASATGDVGRLRDLARVVRLRCDDGRPVAVICTALAGITDALIDAARAAADGREAPVEHARRELWGRHRALAERLIDDDWEREELYRAWADLLKVLDRMTRAVATLGELSPRAIDAVAVLGERFMAHLVAVLLRRSGVASRMVDGAELIVTDAHFGNARPLEAETLARVRARLDEMRKKRLVPVITGYIGATGDGVVTTLGRGGGDYSATLIGAALDADEVCLWTDVDGILTADPKLVRSAQTLAEISYSEAAEIAALGAEVLHPHALPPLAERGIPLHIRNLARPDHPGTRIVSDPQPSPHAARTIISAGGLSLLSVAARAYDEDWGPALTRMSESSVDILSFTQSVSERSLTLAVRAADAPFARECLVAALARAHPGGPAPTISLVSPVGMVALVSAPGAPLPVPRILSALGRAEAQLLSFSQGASHVILLLPEASLPAAVQALHGELGLG